MDPAQAWERLKSTLNGTTVALHSSRQGANEHGTGFFVGPGLVLTCAHVVLPGDRAAEHVEGVWRRGTEQVSLAFAVDDIDVRPFDGGRGPDLALLRVSGGPPRDQPCVALSRGSGLAPGGQKLYAHGHPGHEYSGGDSFTLEIVGGSWHKSGATLLKVGGSELWAGASGSPVIDEKSGCVIGVVRAKQRRTVPTADFETRLVPAHVVWDTFALLGQEQRIGYGPLDDWVGLLNDGQLREGNWKWTGPDLTGYLTLLREATGRHGYVDVLQRVLRGGSAASGGPPLSTAGFRVPVRAKPGHDAEKNGGADCRPLDAAALLPGAHIVGEAGTGKSTLLRAVARDSAQEWLAGTVGDYVPVYAPAPLLADGIGTESWDPHRWLSRAVSWDLSDAAAKRSGEIRFQHVLPQPAAFEEPPFPARKWLVLIDGVDEVDRGRRKQVQGALAAFANAPQFTLVVASRDPFRDGDGIELPSLETLRLCRLSAQVRRQLAENYLATFGADTATVDIFLGELERLGLSELAMRPLFCVVLCAVYVTSGADGLEGGRFKLLERLTEILLTGAEQQRAGAAPLSRKELRRVLAAHAGELRDPLLALRPSLEELLHQVPSELRVQSGSRPWIDDVQTFLYATGLVASDAPEDQPFSHELLVDYFAACRWASTTPLDSKAVRQVAEDCMKRDKESYALFRAAHLLTTAPGLIADELGAWSPRRRNQAAVMITKLAAEAAPVPPGLSRAAVRALERWARKARPGVPPPLRSPDLPTAPGWPEWAAARVAAAPVAQLRHKGLELTDPGQ
ncbi:trypsin-like peptidase domain-containing protein [Streptomyces sp. NBC_00885]|uniref:trypsin-like peptidase domain-containing protein n=1 Tax=Streptomyces sp. NBC_00885 TaxID=2975857 RepID=UPI00386D200D|nr:trypsin-like peptidase domain-containing protein [Streptomyces sp. NBC_00885]